MSPEEKAAYEKFQAELKAEGLCSKGFESSMGGLIVPKGTDAQSPYSVPKFLNEDLKSDAADALGLAWGMLKMPKPSGPPLYSNFQDFLKATQPSPYAYLPFSMDWPLAPLSAATDAEPPLKPKPAVTRLAKAHADDLCALMTNIYERRCGFPSRLPGDLCVTSDN